MKKSVGLLAAIGSVLLAVLLFSACTRGGGAQAGQPQQQSQGTPAQQDATKPTGWGSRLKLVKERGKLLCASTDDTTAWSFINSQGVYEGFGIDFCKAYAAAIFGDASPQRWEIVPITYADRPAVMQAGKIDVMVLANTVNATREANWGNFTNIIHYEGIGIISRKDSGIVPEDWKSLNGKSVCVAAGTNYVPAAADIMSEHGVQFEVVQIEPPGDFDAYNAGRCDFFIAGRSGLGRQLRRLTDPSAHVVWDSIIAKDPWAMLVPHGDDQWLDIIKLVEAVIINAEELGVTQANVEEMARTSTSARVRRMLGVEGAFGQVELGLSKDFAVNVIKAVGNYGEIWERYFCENCEELGKGYYKPRGPNRLWKDGGLLFVWGLE